MRAVEIAWAAGFFEGEGSIYIEREHKRTGRLRLKASLASTDLDVLERFRDVVGVGIINGPYRSKRSTKPYWHWHLRTARDVINLHTLFEPHLGQRRRQSFIDAYDRLRTEQPPLRKPGRRPGPTHIAGQLSL